MKHSSFSYEDRRLLPSTPETRVLLHWAGPEDSRVQTLLLETEGFSSALLLRIRAIFMKTFLT